MSDFYYKKRSEFTPEEWELKIKCDYQFNKICYSEDFRIYITAKCGICPKGLTFETLINNKGVPEFICCCKNYGYENVINDGISEGTDMGDYEKDYSREISQNTFYECLNYLNTHNKEFLKEVSKYDIFA